MAGTGRRGGHRHGTGRRAAVGLLALVLADAPSASGEDLNLLVTSSANVSGGTVGEQSTTQRSFVQSLDMNYNRSVTPLLSYRLRLRGSDTETTTSTDSTRASSANRFIEPEGDVTLGGPKYSLTAGGRLRQTFASGTQAQALTLSEDREFLRAFLTPDLLPAFTVQYERTATVDDRTPAIVDREETRAIFGATYPFAQKVNLAYTFTSQTTEDNVASRSRDQRSHVGTATYTDSFFSDRLSVNANYLVNRLDTTERFAPVAGAGGLLLLPIILVQAYFLTEVDPTTSAASKPPSSYLPPINPNTSTALSITVDLVVNDGGTPNKNASIAVGLSPGSSVTTVRMTVAPRPNGNGDLVQDALGLTFQVCTGATQPIDQTGWTCVSPASVAPPTLFNDFFEISFGATSGSFLKIHVVSDTNPTLGAFGPLGATAIEVFTPAAAGVTGELTTGNLLQSLTGGIMVRPTDVLTVNANGTFSTNTQDPSDRCDDSGTYSLTATGTPHRLLTATALYQGSFTTSNDPQTSRADTRVASLTVSSTPLPALTASLSGTRSENDLGGATQNRTDAIGFNTALRPYRNLNVDLSTTLSEARNFVDGTKTEGLSAVLNANSALTARLTGLFGYTFSTSEVTGGIAPSSVTSNATFLSLTYTVSRFLNANGRWDLSTSDGNYTVTQQYRLDLIPTLKTSVFITYLRTAQEAAGVSGSINTVTLTARWNISRHVDLNATTNFTRGLTGDTVYGVFSTLAFRL